VCRALRLRRIRPLHVVALLHDIGHLRLLIVPLPLWPDTGPHRLLVLGRLGGGSLGTAFLHLILRLDSAVLFLLRLLLRLGSAVRLDRLWP